MPPEITGVPLQLTSGEWLKVQCHLPWMNVKPQLEFFVNDKKAKHMVSKYYACPNSRNFVASSMSTE